MPAHLLYHRDYVFPGDLASVGPAREQVLEFVKSHGCDEGDCIDIMVALQEALANAALHGCGNDPCKAVQCSVDLMPGEVVITVQDPGPGFDHRKEGQADGATINKSESGRGILLMRGLMSDVSFSHGGSEVRLRKILACHER